MTLKSSDRVLSGKLTPYMPFVTDQTNLEFFNDKNLKSYEKAFIRCSDSIVDLSYFLR